MSHFLNTLAHMNGMKPVNLKLSSKDRSEILLVDIASAGFAFIICKQHLKYCSICSLLYMNVYETAQQLKRERTGISMMYIMHRPDDRCIGTYYGYSNLSYGGGVSPYFRSYPSDFIALWAANFSALRPTELLRQCEELAFDQLLPRSRAAATVAEMGSCGWADRLVACCCLLVQLIGFW